MARPAKYTEARILDAAGRIVAREGPNAATIGAIGNLLSTAGAAGRSVDDSDRQG
jgi:AcrR family transcriptional regulator